MKAELEDTTHSQADYERLKEAWTKQGITLIKRKRRIKELQAEIRRLNDQLRRTQGYNSELQALREAIKECSAALEKAPIRSAYCVEQSILKAATLLEHSNDQT